MRNPVNVRTNGARARGTKITDADGHEIRGVRRCTVEIDARRGDITAALELVSASIEGKAKAEFRVADPADGQVKSVSKIFFSDGTVREFTE